MILFFGTPLSSIIFSSIFGRNLRSTTSTGQTGSTSASPRFCSRLASFWAASRSATTRRTRPINLIIGAGYQIAVTANPVTQNNFVGTFRITF